MKYPRYMMATKAIHKMGDISRDAADLCIVFSGNKERYLGNWVEGFGFVDVRFPVETTRELTEEEYQKFDGKGWGINGNFYQTLKVRETNQKEHNEIKGGGK